MLNIYLYFYVNILSIFVLSGHPISNVVVFTYASVIHCLIWGTLLMDGPVITFSCVVCLQKFYCARYVMQGI